MFLDLALRTGIVVAVIIVTKRYDIWDSSDETQEVYQSTIRWISPYTKQTCDYLNIQLPSLPPQREKSFLGVYYYNQTVKMLVDLLNMFPTYVYAVLEKIPDVANHIASRIREQYDKHQKESEKRKAAEKEKNERKIRIDDRALVRTVEPHPHMDSKCRKKKQTEAKDIPIISSIKETCPRKKATDSEDIPNTPSIKEFCSKNSAYSPSEQQKEGNVLDKKCNFPKCTINESAGWSDISPSDQTVTTPCRSNQVK